MYRWRSDVSVFVALALWNGRWAGWKGVACHSLNTGSCSLVTLTATVSRCLPFNMSARLRKCHSIFLCTLLLVCLGYLNGRFTAWMLHLLADRFFGSSVFIRTGPPMDCVVVSLTVMRSFHHARLHIHICIWSSVYVGWGWTIFTACTHHLFTAFFTLQLRSSPVSSASGLESVSTLGSTLKPSSSTVRPFCGSTLLSLFVSFVLSVVWSLSVTSTTVLLPWYRSWRGWSVPRMRPPTTTLPIQLLLVIADASSTKSTTHHHKLPQSHNST